MRKILAIVKIAIFIFWTLFAYSVYALGFILLKITGSRYEPWRNMCLQLWGKIALICLAIRVEISGKPPDPPFFLVSNHLSYIDIIIFYYCLKTTFVAKSDIKYWPVVGPMARSLGVIFIDRNRKRDVHRVNNLISNRINNHQGVVLFPEGRTSAGDKILPFRPSLLQHPAIERINVHYTSIRYSTGKSDEPASQSVAWWDDESLLPHLVRLASNRSIRVDLTFGDESLQMNDRKELASELQKRVESVFKPMPQAVNSENPKKSKVSA